MRKKPPGFAINNSNRKSNDNFKFFLNLMFSLHILNDTNTNLTKINLCLTGLLIMIIVIIIVKKMIILVICASLGSFLLNVLIYGIYIVLALRIAI